MRDVPRKGGPGRVLWQRRNLDPAALFGGREVEAHLPASTLAASAVTRQFTFASHCAMRHLFMVQRVLLDDAVVEVFDFDFGFVIPGSTNSWEQIVEADVEGGMLPVETLSGRLRVELQFWDKDVFVGSLVVRVWYDAAEP